MHVALVSAPEFVDLDEDLPVAAAALRRLDVTVSVAAWSDPAVDWGRFDVAVVRSTWDYVERRDEFLAWADAAGAVTRLANPAGTLRWNSSKRYLRDLAARGVPVVPTVWPGDGEAIPAAWGEVVVKPAVSAGGRWTGRYADHDAALAFARSLGDAGHDVLVQPYVEAVDRIGEVDVFFFGGVPSHAVRKGAILVPGREPIATHDLAVGQRIDAVALADAPADFAARALAAVPDADRLLYGRVDCVTGADGEVLLLEVELIEPALFLFADEAAASRFAAAVVRWAGGA